LVPGCIPIDIDRFRGGFARRPPGVAHVVYAGKLSQTKGVETLVRALAAIAERNWRATIIGTGPEGSSLESLAVDLGIRDRVVFHGFANQSEMPRLLEVADVVVVPSLRDFRVLIVSEAMASGAAVIVSDATAVWGSGDIVEDGVSGLVHRAGNARELAERLADLIDNPELRGALAQEGRRRVLAQQTPEVFATKLAHAINQTVRPAARSRQR
jgi:glycosyltransferase involved in cell wall biosynthesis